MWRNPVIEAYKSGVDRTLIRENLKLTVEQRFLKLMDLQRFAEALRAAGREQRRSARARRGLAEWIEETTGLPADPSLLEAMGSLLAQLEMERL